MARLNLKSVAESKGHTIVTCSKVSHVSYSTVRRLWNTTTTSPYTHTATLEKLAQGLHVPMREILLDD